MELQKIVFANRSGIVLETNYQFSDGVSIRLSHDMDGSVREDMHVRFRPPNAPKDHLTAVTMADPDPMWDPVAAKCLTESHRSALTQLAKQHTDSGMKPLALMAAKAAAIQEPPHTDEDVPQ